MVDDLTLKRMRHLWKTLKTSTLFWALFFDKLSNQPRQLLLFRDSFDPRGVGKFPSGLVDCTFCQDEGNEVLGIVEVGRAGEEVVENLRRQRSYL